LIFLLFGSNSTTLQFGLELNLSLITLNGSHKGEIIQHANHTRSECLAGVLSQ